MKSRKQIASMGAAAMDEADSRSAGKSDVIQSRGGNKAKGKLAVKSNGAGKLKTFGLSNFTPRLTVKSIEDELHALFVYKDQFWMNNFKGVRDMASVHAIRAKAAENWKFFTDSEKAPYVARARLNKVIIANAHAKANAKANAQANAQVKEFNKTLKLTHRITDKMTKLKM